MARNARVIEEKLYYSISEVALMTDLEAYVLRFWEKEFPMLRPRKSRGGNRTYQVKDIEMVNRIKQLLYVENYTIEGARVRLRSLKPTQERRSLIVDARARTILAEIKRETQEALRLLE
ncbi:MAG: MerR family transcriptional regulator [candidate division Zixibacteria bacterium]|nr:MerR family transcriptional regulator [candidate division Zixibacteria bacterium]